jgi:DNA-binding SARP family transcriptional activator
MEGNVRAGKSGAGLVTRHGRETPLAAVPAAQVEIRVLGPLEIRSAGQPVPAIARKPRQLLALLLFNIGRKVPVDTLVDGIWEDRPPRTARATLQTYVVQLRHLLDRPVAGGLDAKELLVTVEDGYLFRPAGVRFDLAEYRELDQAGTAAFGSGDLTRANRLLRAALSCWRGDAIADVRLSRLLQSEVDRLTQARIRTAERSADVVLRLGGHAELLDELSLLCRENPLNENLHLEYMVALHRAGRRIESLRTFQTLRVELADSLGLEPAMTMRRLHEAARRADGALDRIHPEAYLGVDPRILDLPGRRQLSCAVTP